MFSILLPVRDVFLAFHIQFDGERRQQSNADTGRQNDPERQGIFVYIHAEQAVQKQREEIAKRQAEQCAAPLKRGVRILFLLFFGRDQLSRGLGVDVVGDDRLSNTPFVVHFLHFDNTAADDGDDSTSDSQYG